MKFTPVEGKPNHYFCTMPDGSEMTVVTQSGQDPEVVLYEAANRAPTYADYRVAEYPPAGEQFDMIFHDFDNWKRVIEGIKAKYPKPKD